MTTTQTQIIRTRHLTPRRRVRFSFRSIPVIVWVLLFSITPNLIMLVYSLWSSTAGAVNRQFTFENYVSLLEDEVTRVLLIRTVTLAATAGLIATLLGFVLAYLVVRHFSRFKLLITMLVIIPLWVSLLMRTFAWKVILGEHGVLNGFLQQIGIIDEPLTIFLYSPVTVIVTLVYVGIPYAYLACYVTLDRIPNRLFEASGDLGANGIRTFWEVVLPIGKPAIGLSFVLVFILSYGDYVTPTLVGGFQGTMVGSLVIQAFGGLNDWPLGAALSMSTLISALIVVGIVTLLTRNKVILED